MPRAVELVAVLCNIIPDVCMLADSYLQLDGSVDNWQKRFDVFISNEPSGQSYRTFLYYSQIADSARYELYDYGLEKNLEVYNRPNPPLIPIEDYNVPTALLSGDLDELADQADVAWISE